MIDENENTFIVVNEAGEEILCDILFTFDNNENGKSYVVYTDNSKDEVDGKIKVFASIIDKSENGETILKSIETQKEWQIIEATLSTVIDEVNKIDE